MGTVDVYRITNKLDDGTLGVFHDAAAAAYKQSTLAIDSEHRAILNACLFERVQVEPLFDCAVTDPGAGQLRR